MSEHRMIRIEGTRTSLNEKIIEVLYQIDFKKTPLSEVVYKIMDALEK